MAGRRGVLLGGRVMFSRGRREFWEHLFERLFRPAGLEPGLSYGLGPSLSGRPDFQRGIERENAPTMARVSDLT